MSPRTYTLKRRAELQAQTRQRIVEAAIELHGTVGPARTTVSMIAEKAGVQRHTYYAHFPEELDLLRACSGLHAEKSPVPDATAWRAIADPVERLRAGLRAMYDWYAPNAQLLTCVLRDAEIHPGVREVIAKHFDGPIGLVHEVLGEKLGARQRPLLLVALSFFTWRTLALEAGLKQDAAVETMVQAITRS